MKAMQATKMRPRVTALAMRTATQTAANRVDRVVDEVAVDAVAALVRAAASQLEPTPPRRK